MFFTTPELEQKTLSRFAGGGQQWWKAVTAEFPVDPMYMFVYIGRVLDRRMPLIRLEAWEESLVQFIDSVPPEDHRTLHRVAPTAAGGLTVREVQAIWTPKEDGTHDGLKLVLAMGPEPQLLSSLLRPVPRERLGRLVFEVGPSGYAGTQGHAPADAAWRAEFLGAFKG